MGLTRRGRTSCGGGTRLIRAADGWWALNLSRDADLVPALVEGDAGPDSWATVACWSATRSAAQLCARAVSLGMPAASLGERRPPARPWRWTPLPSRRPWPARRPHVVNLGALWAGPLAAHLLGLAGADVVHVESLTRPDPGRESSPEFYALLRRQRHRADGGFRRAKPAPGTAGRRRRHH